MNGGAPHGVRRVRFGVLAVLLVCNQIADKRSCLKSSRHTAAQTW